MNLLLIFLFVIIANTQIIYACKIDITIRSITNKPFQFEILIPSINSKSEKALFTYKDQQKKLVVDGENCMLNPWVVQTYKQEGKNEDGSDKWVIAKTSNAKLDGNGHMTVEVNDELDPRINKRFGVFCSETILCG